MLAFNKEVISERTPKQEKELQEDVMNLIKQIEKATKEDKFPTHVTTLCNYCGFKSQCPSFKHEVELEKKSIEQFKKDDGVKFVNEFSEIKANLSELKKKEEEFKDKLIEFAKQKGIDIVYGSNMKCSVKEIDKIVMPEDDEEKAKLIKLMKDLGVYEECSMVCYPKLNSKVLKDEIDKKVQNMVDVVKDFRLSLSRKKDGEDE